MEQYLHLQGFTLYFLVDARIGGDVMSFTEDDLDYRGVTKATAEARDRGYVEYNGQRFENVKGFYGSVGGRNGISEYYMYDATNIRLRELSLSYALPRTWLAKTKVFQGIDVSFVPAIYSSSIKMLHSTRMQLYR